MSVKFDTCRFRSLEEEEQGEEWCCGSNKKSGFVCYELDIFELTPNHCENCKKFQSKIIDNGETEKR